MPSALLIGNSDGIGLALTQRLLDRGWTVTGISRSDSPLTGSSERYRHFVVDVRSPEYEATITDVVVAQPEATADEATANDATALDACIYCAGIGESLDLDNPDALAGDLAVFDVNLTGLVRTVAIVVPAMLRAGRGHFIGLSSQGDRFINADAPSYSASKAGMSSYLEAMGLAVRARGVHVSNIRFGFVATKMAKSEVRPFEITADKAARRVERCLARRPLRDTYPKRMAVVLAVLNAINRLRTWLA